ncbi:hypothetical protein [Saccharomonospora sp. CUA-673]|uniref:hypothetical protein n=1 Tax=Saccharomonospora sp. CUA-673 TaxID=1904969 RepID=UPI0013017827
MLAVLATAVVTAASAAFLRRWRTTPATMPTTPSATAISPTGPSRPIVMALACGCASTVDADAVGAARSSAVSTGSTTAVPAATRAARV